MSGHYSKETRNSDLFDTRVLWRESLRSSLNYLLDQGLVLHRLARLHDSNDYRPDHLFMVVVNTSEDSAISSALTGKFKLTQIFLNVKSGSGKRRGGMQNEKSINSGSDHYEM